MTEKHDPEGGRDYRDTLFLPQTEFPMRAGLPQREPELLKRWEEIDLYGKLREQAKGRDKFILHDGPPYANGYLHIGHALNKILKDVVTRSQQMMGYDSNYVPGWDCHGLPIEWKIEEEYRAKGKDKDQVPINRFRQECRVFADRWIDIQREEFKRMGVIGDWDNPYTTMAFASEAQIARELMTFAISGQLYRGSKPVMWSVVERTALAEAEVEYHEHTSDTVWVKFPVIHVQDTPTTPADMAKLQSAAVVIWTTTPWTIPGNRAICFSPKVSYGLYQVTDVPDGNWVKKGEKLIFADALADQIMGQARVEGFRRLDEVNPGSVLSCAHPLADLNPVYGFDVPMLSGDHVTDSEGTGFVHTAPGHGREDYEIWKEHDRDLTMRGIDTTIPFTVGADGAFTADAPGFEGKRVIDDKGRKGDANEAVIDALKQAGMLIARSRLKHQYPHSWRSKKPVIFRNTPQWFVYMDRDIGEPAGAGKPGDSLRARALKAIDETRFVPRAGQTRLRGMIADRPDWVLSRQRAWGVPITVFRNTDKDSDFEGELLPGSHPDWRKESKEVAKRIAEAFETEGADCWFAEGAKARFLDGIVDDPGNWEQVSDILDVWFDSGSTHAFVLEQRPDLMPKRAHQGGNDKVLYLEGSDQHRGWFHSSLLESCGTRGHAPYDAVLTHGFVVDEEGRKMSKSLGNIVAPQNVIKENGSEILRLWVISSDYAEDLRIGPEIIKSNVDAYRKLRNTMRFLLGNLHGFSDAERITDHKAMPELERLMLHHLAVLDETVRKGYADFDFKRVFSRLFNFATVDLSAFYLDIRKDALYCDPMSSATRKSCRTVLDHLFSCLTAWLAPMLSFTMDEAWLSRFPNDASVHLRTFPAIDPGWRDDALAAKWSRVRQVRRVVTGALEVERREKRIGSSLSAAPVVYVKDAALAQAVEDIDLAEISITSQATLVTGPAPGDVYTFDEVAGVGVAIELAEGTKCARSWKVLPEVGSDPDYPDLSPRDAAAVREHDQRAA